MSEDSESSWTKRHFDQYGAVVVTAGDDSHGSPSNTKSSAVLVRDLVAASDGTPLANPTRPPANHAATQVTLATGTAGDVILRLENHS